MSTAKNVTSAGYGHSERLIVVAMNATTLMKTNKLRKLI